MHNIITEAFSQGPNRQTGKIRSWPFNVYVLSGAGLALGSFAVMADDLLKTLPPGTLLNNSANNVLTNALSNQRQQDLDSLVNNLPASTAGATPSDEAVQSNATAAANAAAQSATATTPTTTTQPAPTTTPKASTPAPTQSAPAPTPTCTTTASGVTTC